MSLPYNKARTAPFPSEGFGLLIGWPAIQTYMRHRLSTIQRWRDKFDFPISVLPGGNVCTTTSLIDAWLLARAEAYKTDLAKRRARKPLPDAETPLSLPPELEHVLPPATRSE